MRRPGNGGTDDRGRHRVSAYWRDRRVLVTGCTGLLGSWLTEKLVAEEAEVVGLVRDSVPRSRLISEGLVDRIDVV